MNTIDLVKKYQRIFHTDYTQDANCQGAWLFTEGSGESVADSSQNSNTGTFKGPGEPAWSSDKPTVAAYSVNCDGSDDVITVAHSSTLAAGECSAVLWANFSSLPGGGTGTTPHYIMGKDKDWCFKIHRADTYPNWTRRIGFGIYSDSASFWYTATASSTVLAIDTWYHFMGTWTGGSGSAQIYIFLNGVDDGTSAKYGDFVAAGNAMEVGLLGAEANIVPTLQTEIAFFDRVLDSTEVNDIMDNGLKPGAPPAIATGIMTTRTGYWGDL